MVWLPNNGDPYFPVISSASDMHIHLKQQNPNVYTKQAEYDLLVRFNQQQGVVS